MKTRILIRTTFLVVALLFSMTATVVFAGSTSFSGTLTGSPTMPVVFISTPNCTGQGATQVHYDARLFTVSETGAYNFSVSGGAGGDVSIYIMDSGFNPAAAFGNCIAGSNSGTPTTLNNVNLTANTPYYMVMFDDTFGQAVPGYTLSANGVGDFNFGGACTNPLPSGAVIRNVPLGAPVYYDANLETRTNFDLPSGNWYVTQTSGDFAQVWIACQANLIWIPTTALGG